MEDYEDILNDIENQIEQQYKLAEKLLNKAKNGEDVFWTLMACNRGNRPEILLSAIEQIPMSDDTINDLIEFVWTDNELVYEWQYIWDDIWCYFHSNYQKKLKKRIFKQPIKLYRAGNLNGIYQSWTFNKKVAKVFADRRRESNIINERYFNEEDVVAIFNNRKEQEVVVKLKKDLTNA